MHYDAISGEVLEGELIAEARTVEVETFRKHEAYEKAPTQECWENAGKSPVGVKRDDANKGDKENPEHRRRLVAKETERA